MIDIKIGPMTLVYLQEIVCVVEIGDLVDTTLLAVARKEHRIISLIGRPHRTLVILSNGKIILTPTAADTIFRRIQESTLYQ